MAAILCVPLLDWRDPTSPGLDLVDVQLGACTRQPAIHRKPLSLERAGAPRRARSRSRTRTCGLAHVEQLGAVFLHLLAPFNQLLAAEWPSDCREQHVALLEYLAYRRDAQCDRVMLLRPSAARISPLPTTTRQRTATATATAAAHIRTHCPMDGACATRSSTTRPQSPTPRACRQGTRGSWA